MKKLTSSLAIVLAVSMPAIAQKSASETGDARARDLGVPFEGTPA
jgi:hypothetical protein